MLQSRLEAAEAEVERERGLHRRELRRRAKETQEVRVYPAVTLLHAVTSGRHVSLSFFLICM